MNIFKNIKLDYLRSRAKDIQNMPFCSKKYYEEILEIERDLDNLIPGWDEPLRTSSYIGMRGLYGVQNLTAEEVGEAKRLLLLRKLRWSGKANHVMVSYCEITGKPVAFPVK